MAARTLKQLSAAISVLVRFPERATTNTLAHLVRECLEADHLKGAMNVLRRWGDRLPSEMVDHVREVALGEGSPHQVLSQGQWWERTRHERSLEAYAETGFTDRAPVDRGAAGLLTMDYELQSDAAEVADHARHFRANAVQPALRPQERLRVRIRPRP